MKFNILNYTTSVQGVDFKTCKFIPSPRCQKEFVQFFSKQKTNTCHLSATKEHNQLNYFHFTFPFPSICFVATVIQ